MFSAGELTADQKQKIAGQVEGAQILMCHAGSVAEHKPAAGTADPEAACDAKVATAVTDSYKELTPGQASSLFDQIQFISARSFFLIRNNAKTAGQPLKQALAPFLAGGISTPIAIVSASGLSDYSGTTLTSMLQEARKRISSGAEAATIEPLNPPVPNVPAESAESKAFIKAATPLLGAARKTHAASIDKALKEFAGRVDTVTASLPAAEGSTARKTLFDQAKTKVADFKTAYLAEAKSDEGKAFATLLSNLYGLIPVLNMKADKTLELYILETVTSLVAPVLKMIGDKVDADGEEALALVPKLLIRAMSHPNVTKKDAANLTALAGALAEALKGPLKDAKTAKDAKPILEKIFNEQNIDVEVDGDGKATKVSFSERKVTGGGLTEGQKRTAWLKATELAVSASDGGLGIGFSPKLSGTILDKGPLKVGLTIKGAFSEIPAVKTLAPYGGPHKFGWDDMAEQYLNLKQASLDPKLALPFSDDQVWAFEASASGPVIGPRIADVVVESAAGNLPVGPLLPTLEGSGLLGALGKIGITGVKGRGTKASDDDVPIGRLSLAGFIGSPLTLGLPSLSLGGTRGGWGIELGGDIPAASDSKHSLPVGAAFGCEYASGEGMPKPAGSLCALSAALAFTPDGVPFTFETFARYIWQTHELANNNRSGGNVGGAITWTPTKAFNLSLNYIFDTYTGIETPSAPAGTGNKGGADGGRGGAKPTPTPLGENSHYAGLRAQLQLLSWLQVVGSAGVVVSEPAAGNAEGASTNPVGSVNAVINW